MTQLLCHPVSIFQKKKMLSWVLGFPLGATPQGLCAGPRRDMAVSFRGGKSLKNAFTAEMADWGIKLGGLGPYY